MDAVFFHMSKGVKQLRGVGGGGGGELWCQSTSSSHSCHHHHHSLTPSHSTCESPLPRHTAIPHIGTEGDNIFTGRRMTSISPFTVWWVASLPFPVWRTTSKAILHPQAATHSQLSWGWLGYGSQGQANNPMSQSQRSWAITLDGSKAELNSGQEGSLPKWQLKLLFIPAWGWDGSSWHLSWRAVFS